MTTFHELLGTDDNCSKAEIKKKYRQLSMKLHPDKEGSQALMRILSMAYQQVSKGNGNKKCSEVTIQRDLNNKAQQQQTVDFKKQVTLLIKEKTQLQALIERYQQEVGHAYNAGENRARQTLVLLQTTNNGLNEQLVLLQRQIDSSESNGCLSENTFKKMHCNGFCCFGYYHVSWWRDLVLSGPTFSIFSLTTGACYRSSQEC